MDATRRTYSNGEVTVVWEPGKCAHSGICFRGLPKVFDPRRKPWVELTHAASADIVAQVKECPSGALSLAEPEVTDPGDEEIETDENVGPTVVEVTAAGPLVLSGAVLVRLADGTEQPMEGCKLCRCGGSKTKPFCDGTHRENGFQG